MSIRDDITIRRVTKDDIPGRAAVFYVRIRAMNVDEFGIAVDREIDEKEDFEYIAAFKDEHPIAACRIHYVDEKTAKIERVVTVAEYRGKGIGRIIIGEAEEWIREHGINKIVITSRDAAVGFYEKLGYTAYPDRIKNDPNAFFKQVYTEKIIND